MCNTAYRTTCINYATSATVTFPLIISNGDYHGREIQGIRCAVR